MGQAMGPFSITAFNLSPPGCTAINFSIGYDSSMACCTFHLKLGEILRLNIAYESLGHIKVGDTAISAHQVLCLGYRLLH